MLPGWEEGEEGVRTLSLPSHSALTSQQREDTTGWRSLFP